jgi:hypothetical protein
MIDRVLSMMVAVSLALLVWLYARSRDQETLDNVPVPVQITLAAEQAEHYSLDVLGPSQVLVSFSGPPSRIRELQGMLQHHEVQVPVTLTVPDEHQSASRYSDTVVVESSEVRVPPGVTAVMVEGRNRIAVTLHHLTERRLPVHLDCTADEPAGPVVLEPATVLVRGPQEVLDRAHAIPTRPTELPARAAHLAPVRTVMRVALVHELEGRPVRTVPDRVTVRVPARPRRVYELADVPIHFLCPADSALRPKFFSEHAGRITLRLTGPVQEDPPRVYTFVDLTHGHFTAGRYHEPIQVQLPKDFQLAQDPPRSVSFQLTSADDPPAP